MRRTLLTLLLVPATLAGQEQIEFSQHTWTTAGVVEVGEHLGRTALRMRGGRALLENVDFSNGVIEFDIAVAGYRSFVGITFRRDDTGGQAEFFYLRPHQSNRFDALQYTPVENGISAWQLFPEYNAEVAIPADTWIPVRLDVSGDQLTVYVGDGGTPALQARLATDRRSGAITLNSGVPGGSGGLAAPPDLLPTAYSNFRVTPREAPAATATVEAPAPTYVMRWELSEAVAGPEEAPVALTAHMVPGGTWTPASPDHTGRLNLARYRAFPEGANRAMVLARTVVTSDRAQEKGLGIGFSDVGSVFLNGHLVYQANNTYLARSGRYLGVMSADHDQITLRLQEGRNEIVVAVIENFGGWGLVARWEDLEGLN